MAILDQQHLVGTGMVKEIEASAISLVLQNLQQDQYQYPEKSFIRETASNCVDSINEKHTAISILSGESKVEDHYANIESEITNDSKFDPEYYDVKFLNSKDEILITYVNREEHRDKIMIQDTGVGLGGKRLQGYFKLSYSSKRLNKSALGKYGIGAKAGLSTGVESFQIISRHNGREYRFDIYNDRYFSTVEKFNSSGEINPHEVWKSKRYNAQGEIEEFDNVIYYEETTEYNGLTVLMDVKNPIRNRSKYIDAVKSQLTYFDHVKFVEEWSESGRVFIHDVKDSILYQDDSIIIPKESNYYAIPHLILNKVNYGPIDFGECEMDSKKGNIGIIGNPSEIDVNQSRETVRYTEKTRNSIKKYLENSIQVANKYIEESLKDCSTDYLKWLNACNSIKAQNSSSNLLYRLSGLIDVESVELNFKTEKGSLKYYKNLSRVFQGFTITCTVITEKNGSFRSNTANTSWFDMENNIIVYRDSKEDRISAITMAYILQEKTGRTTGNVYMITQNDSGDILLNDLIDETKLIEEYVLKSELCYANYADIEVPEDFYKQYKDAQEKQEKLEEELRIKESLTKEEIRKRDGTFIFNKFVINGRHYMYRSINLGNLTKTRVEIAIDYVPSEFSKETTVYGTVEDIPLISSIIHSCSGLISEYNRVAFYQKNGNLNFIIVSKQNVQYIENYATHIKKALQNVEGTKLSLMASIRNYNTAKVFAKLIESREYYFMYALEFVDTEAYKAYKELKNFRERNGFGYDYRNNGLATETIEKYLSDVANFQLFLIKETDPEAIKAESMRLFNNPTIDACDALNLEVYSKFKALEDFTENIRGVLKPYGSDSSEVNPEAIKEYLQLKGVSEFSEYLKERDLEFKVTRNNID